MSSRGKDMDYQYIRIFFIVHVYSIIKTRKAQALLTLSVHIACNLSPQYLLLNLTESDSHPTPDPHSDNAGPATRSFVRNNGKCCGMSL